MQEQDVLNLIADIKSLNAEQSEMEARVAHCRQELEDADNDLADIKQEIRAKRNALDTLIDDLIPEDDHMVSPFR